MPKVQMPQLGESVAEGTIGKWLKKPGDHVAKYEPLVEVITDKVNAEVPSPFEGTLTEILVQEGETVPNRAEIAVIESSGADAADDQVEPAPAPAQTAPADQPAPGRAEPIGPYGAGSGPGGSDESPVRTQPPAAPPVAAPAMAATTDVATAAATGGNGQSGNGYHGPVTPAVKRLAREHGVELSAIAGTGHGGRVTREDVLKFVESGGQAVASASPKGAQTFGLAQPSGPSAAAVVPSAVAPVVPSAAPSAPSPVAQGDSLKPASPMRKAIAAQMTRSLSVPVAYTIVEVDMSGVVALRDKSKRDYEAREGVRLSYDAFVAKAVVEALRRHPDFNAHSTEEGHWRRARINLGAAVALDDGLVVPVIKDADRLSIHGLNRQIRELAEKARAGRLGLDDIQGGTFTLDNTGWTGSIVTAPIINAPEVGILTMESIVKRPVVIETASGDTIGIRPMMNMCLGFDHRVTDGGQAGRFIADVRRWLEAVDSSTAIW